MAQLLRSLLCVTPARQIHCGDLYLITRRVSERRFFLRPSPRLNRVVEYILAVLAAKTGVQLHAVCVLSNHWHAVASDPEARLPEFLREAHSLIARHLNQDLGRWENFWSVDKTNLVLSKGDRNVRRRIVYTMANPVSASLVAFGNDWPGLRTMWPEERKEVARPKGFFREAGPMPELARLELVRPPGFESMTDAELGVHLAEAVEAKEAMYRKKRQKAGLGFLGRRAVRKQSPWDAPKTRAPRRRMAPRVGIAEKWERIKALERLRIFIERYKEALRRWRLGDRDVEFPPGTYRMRIEHAVRIASG